MDPTKSRGRGRLLMCFKPTVDGDDGLGCDLAPSSSSGDESSGGRRKKRVRRSFYAAAKAALFNTSLLKNLRGDENSNKQDLCRTSNSLSSKSKRFVKSMKNFSYKSCWEPDQEIDLRTDSSNSSLLSSDSITRHTDPSSLSSSSSSSSSLSANSGSNRIGRSDDSLDFGNNMSGINYRQKSTKREYARKCVQNNSTLEMSLIVICLGALILWGKAFAILTCTSTLLLFSPRRRGRRLRRVDWAINNVGGV